jgi:hypothetical protein
VQEHGNSLDWCALVVALIGQARGPGRVETRLSGPKRRVHHLVATYHAGKPRVRLSGTPRERKSAGPWTAVLQARRARRRLMSRVEILDIGASFLGG